MFNPNDPKWKIAPQVPQPGDHDYREPTRLVTIRIPKEDESAQRDAHEIAGIRTPTQCWRRGY